MGRRSWLWLGLLMAAALAVRLAALFRLPAPELSGDALQYSRMAVQLLTQHNYGYNGPGPNAYVTPGYPLFLTAVYWLKGGGPPGVAAVGISQALLGALTLWPFFLLARRYAGEGAAIVAGLLLALHPAWVRAPAYLLTEVLFTFLFGWYLWLQMSALCRWQTVRWPLCTGATLAAAVLVRPAVAPLLVLPWLYQFWLERDRRLWQPALWAAGGFSLVMLPWWIRNSVTLHRWIFLATQTGNPVLGGMDPYGRWGGALWAGVGGDTGDQLRKAGQLLVWLLRYHTWLTLRWFTFGKFSRIFLSPWLGWEVPALNLVHWVVVLLGWMGAMALWRRRHPLQLLSLILGCLTLVQLAFIPEPRYAYPLVGLLAILAGVATRRIFAGGEPDAPPLAGCGAGIQRSGIRRAGGD